MRVRYQMAGDGSYRAECDLSEDKARKLYETVKRNGECMWAELVGEEEENYMDILEQYDNTEQAMRLHAILEGFRGR